MNGLRQAFEAAVDAGVVPIVSAGNNGAEGDCTVNPTATYASTISVGATNDAINLPALESVVRASFSSYGSTNTAISGGRTVTDPLITVVANGKHKMLAGSDQTGIINSSGTSFSAPSIAGITGLIKHWIWYRGGLPQGMANDPIAIRAILSLMGDGRTSSTDALTKRDPEFGYGNVRFVNFDSDTGAEGSWGIKKISVSNGSITEWKIGGSGATSDQLKGFKAVAIADRYNRGTSPDLQFELVDKCSSNVPITLLTADPSALEWRLRVMNTFSQLFLHDRCLWLRVAAQSATGSTNLYVAWVLYSNDRLNHDASNL